MEGHVPEDHRPLSQTTRCAGGEATKLRVAPRVQTNCASAVASPARSQLDARFRPASLARYSAASHSFTSVVALAAKSAKPATPMLAVTRRLKSDERSNSVRTRYARICAPARSHAECGHASQDGSARRDAVPCRSRASPASTAHKSDWEATRALASRRSSFSSTERRRLGLTRYVYLGDLVPPRLPPLALVPFITPLRPPYLLQWDATGPMYCVEFSQFRLKFL